VGNFLWVQNRDALRYLLTTLWPEIRQRYDGATLKIVGRHLPDNLRTLLTKHTLLLEDVKDIQTEFHAADIMLAPIYVGGGTKFKILEAMASGIPVVTTPLGVQGLEVTSGNQLYVAQNTEDFVIAIQKLLDAPNDTKKMVTSARNVIEQQYSWKHIGKLLNSVWEKAYENRS
jgi:glycosyltransferase involved in cell wall biosynthesis